MNPPLAAVVLHFALISFPIMSSISNLFAMLLVANYCSPGSGKAPDRGRIINQFKGKRKSSINIFIVRLRVEF